MCGLRVSRRGAYVALETALCTVCVGVELDLVQVFFQLTNTMNQTPQCLVIHWDRCLVLIRPLSALRCSQLCRVPRQCFMLLRARMVDAMPKEQVKCPPFRFQSSSVEVLRTCSSCSSSSGGAYLDQGTAIVGRGHACSRIRHGL